MKKTVALTITCATGVWLLATPVRAVELTVESNGSESDNQVSISQETNTNIEQQNDTSINNQIDADANTGDNSIKDSQESSIDTGVISIDQSVDNDINHNQVNSDCCQSQDSQITISGNGENSTNQVNLSQSQQTTVAVQQSADINNHLNTHANTGRNTIDGSHDAAIFTGDITDNTGVSHNLNRASVTGSCCQDGSLRVKIKSNGSGSINTITGDFSSTTDITIDQDSHIDTNIDQDLNTGENSIDDAIQALIETGSITVDKEIETKANYSEVVCITCDEDGNGDDQNGDDGNGDDHQPPPVTPPANNGGNGGYGGNGGNGSGGNGASPTGQVLGMAQDIADTYGRILPATGTSNLLLLIIANALMYLLGGYLRLHSGRSPALALAYSQK